MKARLDRDDVTIEYDAEPISDGRFRALCRLAGCVAYAGMVSVVALTCGLPGVVAVGVATILCVAILGV